MAFGAENWWGEQNSITRAQMEKIEEEKAKAEAERQRLEKQKLEDVTGANDPYLMSLRRLIDNPGAEMAKNPFFSWQQDQGVQAVNRSMAANGMRNSGNRMMALSDYAQKQSGQNFFTLADLFSALGSRNVANKQAYYGLKNQDRQLGTQEAEMLNNALSSNKQINYARDQQNIMNQYAQQGIEDARQQGRMAQFKGMDSGQWFKQYSNAKSRGDSDAAAYAYGMHKSAPLFF